MDCQPLRLTPSGLLRFGGELCRFETHYHRCEVSVYRLTQAEKLKWLARKKLFELCVGYHWSYRRESMEHWFGGRRPEWLHKMLFGCTTHGADDAQRRIDTILVHQLAPTDPRRPERPARNRRSKAACAGRRGPASSPEPAAAPLRDCRHDPPRFRCNLGANWRGWQRGFLDCRLNLFYFINRTRGRVRLLS